MQNWSQILPFNCDKLWWLWTNIHMKKSVSSIDCRRKLISSKKCSSPPQKKCENSDGSMCFKFFLWGRNLVWFLTKNSYIQESLYLVLCVLWEIWWEILDYKQSFNYLLAVRNFNAKYSNHLAKKCFDGYMGQHSTAVVFSSIRIGGWRGHSPQAW